MKQYHFKMLYHVLNLVLNDLASQPLSREEQKDLVLCTKLRFRIKQYLRGKDERI